MLCTVQPVTRKRSSVEREERGPEGKWRGGLGLSVAGRQAVTSWERYTPSQFRSQLQMGAGKWQNGRELYRQAMPGQALSKAISHVVESPGKAPSV